jgi:pyruvate dehydrogenase E1 component
MTLNITVPDIGDFESVEIIEVLVKVGDQINKNDPIVTLESDKSSVEVPAPYSGKILTLNVKIGDKVSKGSLLAKLENSTNDNVKKETITTNQKKYYL